MKQFVLRALAALAVCFGLGLTGGSVHAQSSGVVANYLAGWNMVGGPVGTSFAAANTIDAYGVSGYIPGSRGITSPCEGYWADFDNPTTIPLPVSTGPAQGCTLATGWNIVGNPFSGAAALPAGMTGYYWNPDRGAYDTVTAIPPGASAWIYVDSPQVVTLHYGSATTRTPETVEVDSLNTLTGPVTLHVGDSLKLVLSLAFPHRATADSLYLHLETAGESGDLSCVGSGCAFSIVNQFWIWHAVAPGNTGITVSAACRYTTPACATPDILLPVIVLP